MREGGERGGGREKGEKEGWFARTASTTGVYAQTSLSVVTLPGEPPGGQVETEPTARVASAGDTFQEGLTDES